MELVIVESPAKARTIESYLGGRARVLASVGHVRDLPARDGSVDPDHGFAMRWEVSADRHKQIRDIVAAAREADRVILATDPDREGEAISWHLAEVLHAKKAVPPGGIARITFNAVTKDAVQAAMANPRHIDQPLVDAYLARRALDYLVGFTLSPVLWRRLRGAKSAGRVQSVALRLIVDREREIEAFVAREYWTVTAAMESQAGHAFPARLHMLDGQKLDKFALGTAAEAEAARARVLGAGFSVAAVETKPLTRNPAAPFTTSTLQQEASRKLGMGAQQAMRTAQALYEAGHITYMRTDGVAMEAGAIAAARAEAARRHGEDHVPDKPRHYSVKAKNAQEAHEAIRPTDFAAGPGALRLGTEEARLYELIWKRAVASQMASARLERTTVDLLSQDGRVGLRASGTVLLFPGFLALYAEDEDDAEEEEGGRLPRLTKGEQPDLKGAEASQHFTQPPPRFSEASLVKRLEELGIGRPSTYASIIQTLKDRAYVRLDQKRFLPEEKGRLVTAFLERFFERYVSYDFTAGLEEDLDRISAGTADWLDVLGAFWTDFKPLTEEVMQSSPMEVEQALDAFLGPHLFPARADGADPRTCPSCSEGRLALKVGRYGPFITCSNYPECRYTRPFGTNGQEAPPVQDLGTMPETGEAIAFKSGRFGPYLQAGERRVSVPKDVGEIDRETALRLLSLPREVGIHPETGKPILANIGKYGPYLLHEGRYANLKATEELFTIGMNAAVHLLAQPKRAGRASPEPLRVLGVHPQSGVEVKLMSGRYGPYVSDGVTNATLPKAQDPQALSLEEGLALLEARAGAAPKKGKRTAGRPAKKAATRKAAASPAKARTSKKPPAKART